MSVMRLASLCLLGLVLALAVGDPAGALVAFDPAVPVTSPVEGRTVEVPGVAADAAGGIHVVWWGLDFPVTGSAVYHARSEGGGTFTAPQVVFSQYSRDSMTPRIATGGGAIYVLITTVGKGNPGALYLVRSTDGGQSFTAPRHIAGYGLDSGELAVEDGRVLVVWRGAWFFPEGGNTMGIQLWRSDDGGTTFTGRLLVDEASAGVVTSQPAIAAARGRVYVAWTQRDAAGGQQVWLSRSVDGGETFSAGRNVSQAPIEAHSGRLHIGPTGTLYLVWEQGDTPNEERFQEFRSPHMVLYSRSSDGGGTFSPPMALSQHPSLPSGWGRAPRVVEPSPGAVVVAFESVEAADTSAVVVRASTDGGASFDTPRALGEARSGRVALASAPNGFSAVWAEPVNAPGTMAPGNNIVHRRGVVQAAPSPPGPPTPPAPLSVRLQVDRPVVQSGDVLRLGVILANPGESQLLDVYFGALLPPAAGPDLGCPLGDAVAFLADGFARVVLTCLSAPRESFAPLARAVTVGGSMPATAIPLQPLEWPAGTWTGSYTFFLALTPPGAVTAGRTDTPAVVAVATALVVSMP